MKLNDKGFAPTLLFGSILLNASDGLNSHDTSKHIKNVLKGTEEEDDEIIESINILAE